MLSRLITAILVGSLCSIAFAGGGYITTVTKGDFRGDLCSASVHKGHVFVVPVELFKKHSRIRCAIGHYGLRTHVDRDDPGHVIYNIDPPEGVEKALDCDAKADKSMRHIGLNCWPVYREAAKHHKFF